jgi:hypothetical protein
MIEVGDFFLTFILMVYTLFWHIEASLDIPKPSKFYVEVAKMEIPHLGIEVGDFDSVVQDLHPLF